MALILVIDDEAPIRENLMRFLRLEGHRVCEAADGQQGLETALASKPDLIFCDMMMPRMNGLQVLEAVRHTPELAHIPVVFLSASAEPEQLEHALLHGASAYITKPFNLGRLRDTLKDLLTPDAAS